MTCISNRTFINLHAYMHTDRAVIAVNSDNVTALTMAPKLKAKAGAMSIIARELALDIADSLYCPSTTAHLPGVMNGVADELSRKHQPGRAFLFPPSLQCIQSSPLSARPAVWWRSMPTSS